MRRNVLAGWNRNRLRLVLMLFFIALAIPTAILVKQAYSQLKWEAFHTHRVQAEELVQRIDNRYRELIKIESARSFTDYSFLNIAGDPAAKLLQRSPLASFPVRSALPGVIGYFQIDTNGRFSSPLLPEGRGEALRYGIGKDELTQRQQVYSELHRLLSENRLVQSPRQIARVPGTATEKTEAAGKPAEDERDVMSGIREPVASVSPVDAEKSDQSAPAPLWEEQVPAQAAFDRLLEQKAAPSSIQQKTIGKLGRVEDLKLEKRYRQKLELEKKKQESPVVKQKETFTKRMLRKERNVLPEQVEGYELADNMRLQQDRDLPVSIFESEIDEFEFSLLDSGHFVLYRKVWREGQRYIQGMLIEAEPFISEVMGKAFYATAVANTSNLAVAYQGNVLTAFNAKSERRYISSASELQGTLLLQDRLSSMLSSMELVFSISRLSAGPGASVINWLAFILLLVLCGGFWLMYRLGYKQLTLIKQQQDFVSAVSHELKTPLTSIRMYGEMLREGWADEKKRMTYYDYIYDESERLTRLINNVLQLARMTRNGIQPEMKVYGVVELMDMLRSKIINQVEHAGFEIDMRCDDVEDRRLEVDADFFSQIMINLVDNAIKFSARADIRKIEIHCEVLRDGMLQIRVRDFGPGIPKDQMRRIFGLFYRTESELTRETVGTGIGLALVMELTQAMHGRIDVVNRQPGAEFRVVFPAISNSQSLA